MNTHLTYEQMRNYHQRSLSRDIQRTFRSHIEECESCRRKLCEIANVSGSVRKFFGELELADLKDTKHLTYNKTIAYISDRVDDDLRESLDLHLERCSYCSNRISHLKDFRNSLMDVASEVSASADQPETKSLRTSWIANLKSLLFFNTPSWRYVGITMAASILIITALFVIRHYVGLVPNTGQQSDNKTNIAIQLPPSNVNSKIESSNSVQPTVPSSIVNNSTAKQTKASDRSDYRGGKPPSQPSGRTFRYQERQIVATKPVMLAGLQFYPKEIQSLVKTALLTGRLNIVPLPDLSSDRQTLLGEAEEGTPFPLLFPLGIVIENQQPVFRWAPLSAATAYSISIFDKNGNEVETSPALTSTEWRGSKKLDRGQLYTWQVIATKGGKEFLSPKSPAPEARFIVLDKNNFSQIERVRKMSPDSHLILGVLYAQAHLLNDAEKEFVLLVQADPENPQAKRFLQQVRSLNNIKQ